MSATKQLLGQWLMVGLLISIIGSYFLGYQPIENVITQMADWALIITAFALPIGAINIIKQNYMNINRRRKDWYLDVWMLFCFAIFSVIGLLLGINHSIYQYIYNNISLPIGATIYSITAFFIVSAMYRAFRVRNLESSVLLICAVIVMLKNAPVGAVISPLFPVLGNWLSKYAQSSGTSVMWIVGSFGWFTIVIRYILGLERVAGEQEA